MGYRDTIFSELKLADIFTLSSVFIAVLSVYFIFNNLIEYSFSLVFVCILLDYLDGFVARKMNQQNDFGARLDSLADMLCFGVVPAFLVFQSFSDKGIVAVIGAGVFVIANVLRENRIQKNLGTSSEYKIGVANTVIALLISSFYFSKISTEPYVWNILFFVFSYLLISNIKYATHRKFGKSIYFIAIAFIILSGLSYIFYIPILGFILIFLICIFYIVFGPILRRLK